MNKPKLGMVIYFNPDYYPPTVNAVHLLSEHFDVVLIGRNYDPPNVEYPSNVAVHRLGEYTSIQERMRASPLAKFREYLNFVVQTRRLLKDVSVIYAYDAFAYTAAYLCRLFINKTIPLIYQNHEIEEHLAGFSSLSGWVQRAERAWIHQANLVVFPDRDRATFFQKVTKLKQELIIVPNFPCKSFFTLPEDWVSVIPQRWQSIALFYRGSISDTSAMKEIVIAGCLLKPCHNNIYVKFVGFFNAHDRQELQYWIDHLGMTNYFTYLGTLPYKELQNPTLSSTIGFALYKNTSFDRVACAAACNKIYEYAACGLPVIVSDFSTYRAFLGNESWVRFADPDNPYAIASTIQEILSDFDSYQEMCLAARKAFEEKFNYEAVFAPLVANIQQLYSN
jgi:glycosyltransferase involved in cell wall biosynthesis